MEYQWASIVGRNGRTLTHPLVHFFDERLLSPIDGVQLLPRGTFCFRQELEKVFEPRGESPQDLFLNRLDLIEVFASGKWRGCCGSCGDDPNLEDEHQMPLAYESADCWALHFVRIPEGWYKLQVAGNLTNTPVIAAGTVLWRRKDRLVERALAHNSAVATKLVKDAALRQFRGRGESGLLPGA